MSADTNRNRDRILEAIDQLRRRKARPDIQRICNYLFRRFSVSVADAKAHLQACVDSNVVLKVEYKGSISYRNASKRFAHVRQQRPVVQHPDAVVDENGGGGVGGGVVVITRPPPQGVGRKFVQLLTNAFGELYVSEPDYLESGVPADDIIDNILTKDSVRYTRKYIGILIEKEVESGSLIKMENGNYLLGPSQGDEGRKMNHEHNDERKKKAVTGVRAIMKKDNMDRNDDKKNNETSMNNNLRVGGRRKRAKKVFDPSDTHVPKKRGRPVGSLNRATIEKQLAKLSDESRPESRASNSGSGALTIATGRNDTTNSALCSVCHQQGKKGVNERMISCRECTNKAHFTCLNGNDMMLRMYPDNTWQCPHCKTCVVCFETSDTGSLTVCAICADAYHSNCHRPRIVEKKSSNRWLCSNCEMPDELKINDVPNFTTKINDINDNSSSPSVSRDTTPYHSPPLSPTPPPPHLSPHRNNNANNETEPVTTVASDSESEDERIDPSIPDASNWTYEDVYQYFVKYFPKEAKVFREQEIDGRSLLLLKRSDVIINLKLKLGPALKIYKHVVKLQVRRDDPRLYWL